MQDNTITTIKFKLIEQPKHLDEYFERLRAKYRSQGIHTPKEWPMDTVKGRESYRQSQARERFLVEHSLKDAIARAMAMLETTPIGQKIDFNELIYGQVQ